jgi:hypothetical protein
LDPVDTDSPAPWTPVWIRAGGEPVVDWAIVGEPFADPFFEQTADRAMRRPFNRIFARSTPLVVLQRIGAVEPPPTPDGFVFHMSRSGSTLVAQMLAALPSATVLSEAQPLDAIVTLHRAGRLSEDETVGALRGAVGALAGPRAGEGPLFVKFHASHVNELPLIARAFPATPWVFLFREPRDVLRSQLNVFGAEVFAGKPPDEPDDAYAANVLASFCEAALRHAEIGRSRFVDYARLPDAVLTEILPFFGVALDGDAEQRLRAASRRDTKRPGDFTPRDYADPDSRAGELAAPRLDPAYEALRARHAVLNATEMSE